MGRDVDFRDQGVANFYEGLAGGANKIGLRAPATVAADIDIELLAALPGTTEVLTIDASGQMGTTAVGGGTLDQAYDFSGAGAGRAITADSGAVEITVPAASGNAALSLIQADNFTGLLISKTAVGAGTPLQITDAGTGTSLLVTKTGPSGSVVNFSGGGATLVLGDQLAVTGDNTTGALAVTSTDVGTNPVISTFQSGAGVALHVDNSGNAFPAVVRLESGVGVTDALIEFVQNSVKRWEVGYDQSAGGLVIGRLSFTNPVIFVEDTTGDVGINEIDPDAPLHVTAGVSLTALLQTSSVSCRLGLRASGTTSQNEVWIEADGDNLRLASGGSDQVFIKASGDVGINKAVPAAKLDIREDSNTKAFRSVRAGAGGGDAAEFFNSGTAIGLLLTQVGNGTAFLVDSEATSQPLIELQTVVANTRGDIKFPVVRTAFPTSVVEGDMFYDATLERLGFRYDVFSRIFSSRYGSNFGASAPNALISAGAVTINTPRATLQAETGTADTLDTLNTSPQASVGDEVILMADSGDTITISEGTGNFKLDGAANKTLNSVNDLLKVMWNGTQWVQVSFSNNAA